MKELVLFRIGGHMTILSIQPNGEVAVSSGGSGAYYLRIEPEDKAALLSALAKASEITLPNELSTERIDELVITLINTLFTKNADDPYESIRAFLDEYKVKFRSEYWP